MSSSRIYFAVVKVMVILLDLKKKKKEKSSDHLARFFFGSNTKQDTITELYYSGKYPLGPCYSPTTPVHREYTKQAICSMLRMMFSCPFTAREKKGCLRKLSGWSCLEKSSMNIIHCEK